MVDVKNSSISENYCNKSFQTISGKQITYAFRPNTSVPDGMKSKFHFDKGSALSSLHPTPLQTIVEHRREPLECSKIFTRCPRKGGKEYRHLQKDRWRTRRALSGE
ncbi:hypothetical protein CEXT_341281 [Caerostris extrusa]|uniref:Uncharacterized protein n=1 Tax=Caerostris extrusa TaxID=172846 RepID=A0AAV4U6F0_CAEEX|nr:hypothetical protein CEXT_341281 [Caerostris extrusa]